MLLYKYFAVKYKLRSPTGLLSLSLSSSAIVAANGEITKVMDSEKEETIKKCSLAWPDHSLHRELSLSAYTESIDNTLHGSEVWLGSAPFPAVHSPKVHGPQEKGAGYVTLRSGHTRLKEPQLKE